MPRIPAGRVTESGELIPSGPEKKAPSAKKKKPSVPQDWKAKDKQKRLRKRARNRR
jgi:hypothetical protein